MTPSESLKLMQEASDKFYQASICTQCHAFVEFTGLMNEYIKVCSEFQQANPDADFRENNAHTGQNIPIKPYQKQYILEKLECIYQDSLITHKTHNSSTQLINSQTHKLIKSTHKLTNSTTHKLNREK